jgi:hypothetical protein
MYETFPDKGIEFAKPAYASMFAGLGSAVPEPPAATRAAAAQ